MGEHRVSTELDLARDQLSTLRARLASAGIPSERPGGVWVWFELLGLVDQLRARCALLQALLDRTSEVLFAKDRDGRYLMINPSGAELFGSSVEQIIGRDDTTLFGSERAEPIMALDRDVLHTGAVRTLEQTLDIRGVPTTLRTTESPWYEPLGELRGLIGTSCDVRERERIGQELRESLVEDLHVGLGQYLALAENKLAALRLASGPELREPLAQIERLVEQADRSLRSIAFPQSQRAG